MHILQECSQYLWLVSMLLHYVLFISYIHTKTSVLLHAYYSGMSFGNRTEENATIFCLDIL